MSVFVVTLGCLVLQRRGRVQIKLLILHVWVKHLFEHVPVSVYMTVGDGSDTPVLWKCVCGVEVGVPYCSADWHPRSLFVAPFNLSPASPHNPSPANLYWQVEVALGCPWPPLHGGLARNWIRLDQTQLTLCLRVSGSWKELQVTERLWGIFIFPAVSAMNLSWVNMYCSIFCCSKC